MATKKKKNGVDDQLDTALKEGPQRVSELKKRTGDPDLRKKLEGLRKSGGATVVKGRWVSTKLKVCDGCGGKGWVKS